MSAISTSALGEPVNTTVRQSARPLRILQVGSAFPNWGGTEIHMLNLSEVLVARGHEVTITCRPGRYVEQQARSRGLRTAAATVKRPHDFRNSGRILRLLRSGRFDVVHAHWFNDYLVTPWLARLCGVPAVLMSHHSPYPLKPFPGSYLYQRHLFHRIIALSESVRQNLLGQGLTPEQVQTVHHGIDTETFRMTTKTAAEVRREWGIPDDATIVGMAGRIGKEKGVFPFLEAMAKLKNSPIYAVLIGDGPQEEEARSRAEALGLSSRVIFAGFRSDVNNAINALDALTLASTWAEPCAAVVQQAMALGKPVIGTNIGGTPEMVVGGETGLLVPPDNPEALADAIVKLAASPEKRHAFGEAGCKRVDSLFTLDRLADRIESLYYDLVANKAPQAAGLSQESMAPAVTLK